MAEVPRERVTMYRPDEATARAWQASVRIAVVAVLLVLAYWGVVRNQLVSRWLTDGNWSHGWLVPLFGLYFLYMRKEELQQCKPRPSYWGAVVLITSLGVYLFSAFRLGMGYPQALSLVGTTFGLTWLMGGWPVLRVAWFPIAFLLLAIPLPPGLYVSLTLPLREFASAAAAAVMPLLIPGLHTEAQAVVIDYVMPGRPPGQLNVEEACSGMRSIMAFVTLGVAVAYVHPRPLWQRLVLIASCIPIAVFCNTIRVIITGMLFVTGHREWAQGTPHMLLGVAMFALALGLYSLLGYVLSHLFVEESPEETPERAGA